MPAKLSKRMKSTRIMKTMTAMNLTLKRKMIKHSRTITSLTFKNISTLSNKVPVISNRNTKLKILL